MNTWPVDFERLWRGSLPTLRQFARQVTPGREDAEDLLSNTALRAMQDLAQYESETPFDLWVLRLMADVWQEMVRDRELGLPTVVASNVSDEDRLENPFLDVWYDEIGDLSP